jgi:hypothetical protein
MISPLKHKSFKLDSVPSTQFTCIGQESKNTAVTHTAWVKKPCFDSIEVTHTQKITGYFSYSLLESKGVGIIGVVFKTFKNYTTVTANKVTVTRPGFNIDFNVNFQLERLGLYCYICNNGSVVVIPTTHAISEFMVGV